MRRGVCPPGPARRAGQRTSSGLDRSPRYALRPSPARAAKSPRRRRFHMRRTCSNAVGLKQTPVPIGHRCRLAIPNVSRPFGRVPAQANPKSRPIRAAACVALHSGRCVQARGIPPRAPDISLISSCALRAPGEGREVRRAAVRPPGVACDQPWDLLRHDPQIRMTHRLGLADRGFGLLDRQEGTDAYAIDGPPIIHPRHHASAQTV